VGSSAFNGRLSYPGMMPVITCERCGFEWTVNTIRNKTSLCSSCRARKVQTVHTSHGKCLPWHGNFDPDQITPVDDDGQPILPGIRLCSNHDCVAPSHILADVRRRGYDGDI
jgi:hypothetical protein